MSDLIERLKKESTRANAEDGSECCFAPKWTCCDPALLIEAAARIRELDDYVASLDAAENQLITERDELIQRAETAEAERDGMMKCVIEVKAERDALQRRLEQSRQNGANWAVQQGEQAKRAEKAEAQLFASRDALAGTVQRAETAEAERDILKALHDVSLASCRVWKRCAEEAKGERDTKSCTFSDHLHALKPSGDPHEAQSEKPVNPYLLGGSSTQSEG